MRINVRLHPQAQSAELVANALATLLACNVYEYENFGRSIPDLRSSSLPYRYDKHDPWCDVLTMFSMGYGDCEEWGTAFAAESRVRRTSPFVYVYATQVSERLVHIYNGDGNGNYADLCIGRGMRVPPGLDLQSAYERGFRCPLL